MADPEPWMLKEWEAWQRVAAIWPGTPLPDMNHPRWNLLVRAIQCWGENLVALRVRQTEAIREQALTDAVDRYNAELRKHNEAKTTVNT